MSQEALTHRCDVFRSTPLLALLATPMWAPGRPLGPATACYSLRPAPERGSAADPSSRSQTHSPFDRARWRWSCPKPATTKRGARPADWSVFALAGHARWRGGIKIAHRPFAQSVDSNVRKPGHRIERWPVFVVVGEGEGSLDRCHFIMGKRPPPGSPVPLIFLPRASKKSAPPSPAPSGAAR